MAGGEGRSASHPAAAPVPCTDHSRCPWYFGSAFSQLQCSISVRQHEGRGAESLSLLCGMAGEA